MENNRKAIVTAIQDLIICRNNIFDNIVNIAMSGELNHLAEAIDIGEKYNFKLNHFRNLEDENVNALIRMVEYIESHISVLMDINNIDVSELNFDD